VHFGRARGAGIRAGSRCQPPCRDEHPLIEHLEWVSATSEDADRVDFQWLEGYESWEAMNKDHYTEECKALWERVRPRAIEGTFTGRAWDEGGGFGPR
jgi:hypothetical protein